MAKETAAERDARYERMEHESRDRLDKVIDRLQEIGRLNNINDAESVAKINDFVKDGIDEAVNLKRPVDEREPETARV